MFWIVFAAQFSVASPIGTSLPDVRSLFSPDDMPAYFQVAGESKIVLTRTTVRPDGTADNCVAEQNSQDAKLDALTCAIILRRAKFRPATWMDGSPAYAVLRIPVGWLVSDSTPSPEDSFRLYRPDIDLSVSRLPRGARSPTEIIVQAAADAAGHPVNCAQYFDPRSSSKYFPELISVACQQVMAGFTAVPPLDATGKPVRSVQTVTVRFKLDH